MALLIDDEVGEGEGETTTVEIAVVVDDAIMEFDDLGVGEEVNRGDGLDALEEELVWNDVSDPDGD
jgi:hypothetical protein